MGRLIDLTGQRFGKLVVECRGEDVISPNGQHHTSWNCQCDCGNKTTVRGQLLRNGKTKSCGCLSADISDITGMKFGMLTAVKRDHKEKSSRAWWWIFRCDCGNEKAILKESVTSGKVISCGCFQKTQNGLSDTRIYGIWKNMIDRCVNNKSINYENYGGRGVTVCEEWRNSFQSFYDWSMANGYTDNLTIDRINNDKGYSPDNCRWATRKEQNNNTRRTVRVEYMGKKYTVSELAEKYGINRSTLDNRLRRGWSVERAVRK